MCFQGAKCRAPFLSDSVDEEDFRNELWGDQPVGPSVIAFGKHKQKPAILQRVGKDPLQSHLAGVAVTQTPSEPHPVLFSGTFDLN